MKKFTILFSTIALFTITVASAQRIAVTVAGTGSAALTGDGGSGRAATIAGLKDVCSDADGNLYFTDQLNGRIRKLAAATGVITTIAGGGASLADGVPATNASIAPNYMCVSASGYLYLSTGNEVRKIDLATGIITTVAGNTVAGFTGDGGAATTATLNSPEGVCIDVAGNLYIADRGNNCIRKVNIATGIITRAAGTGPEGYTGDGGPAIAATLYSPIAVCLNASGDLFISDQEPGYPLMFNYSLVRKVSAATGIISTIAGSLSSATSLFTYGVPASDADLGTITGICTDATGNIYFNEMSCSCRKLNMTTDTIELVAGNFAVEGYTDDTCSLTSDMSFPMGICADNAGNLYVADSGNNRIRKLAQESHTPLFAFGHGQYMDPAASTITSIDSLLWITDLDASQTETWTVVTPPVHGLLSGFPATALSNGTYTTVKPSGLSYTAFSTYFHNDFFRVRVSDGSLSDTITIYVGTTILPQSVNNTIASAAAVNVFPNPASSVLNVQWTNMQTGNASVAISDVTGRNIYNAASPINSNNSGTLQIDLSAIPAGVYFVKVDGTEVRKFVKE